MSNITPRMHKFLTDFARVKLISTFPFCTIGIASFIFLIRLNAFAAFGSVIGITALYYIWLFVYSAALVFKYYPGDADGYKEDATLAYSEIVKKELKTKLETKFSEPTSHGLYLGSFNDSAIYDWVEVDSEKYYFDCTTADLEYVQERKDKIIYVSPGIIYKK